MTEDELIARCRAGDEDAFRQLVETYHERVYRTAYALTADPDDASEVVQDTFLKAWRGLGLSSSAPPRRDPAFPRTHPVAPAR